MFQTYGATGHCGGLPARLHRAGRRAISAAALKFATLRRVAPAQTLPRGERGPRLATDLQPRPVPQSTPPKPAIGFGGVLCFQKAKYWDQLPSLSSESKREDATARFRLADRSYAKGELFVPGLSLWIFSRDTLFCLYRNVSYPGLQGSRAKAAYAIR